MERKGRAHGASFWKKEVSVFVASTTRRGSVETFLVCFVPREGFKITGQKRNDPSLPDESCLVSRFGEGLRAWFGRV